MSDLVSSGLLLQDEAACLRFMPSRPQVVWAWMASFFSHLAYGQQVSRHSGTQQTVACLGSTLPYPAMTLVQLHGLCIKARGAIGLIFAYTDTQIPFGYVQLLGVVVWMQNFVQATTSALVFEQVVLTSHMLSHPVELLLETIYLLFYPLLFMNLGSELAAMAS
eukprot:TRINITY_DN18561_c0_g1_i1.p1 TRINITY_DN18561_c0_g1~~TRINITY_DN18561_c0_g1_i1.p1  ORF type:complete len:164 (-),score=25.11 TRINITY_DN18561_c0_g1_i1:60-551(-)